MLAVKATNLKKFAELVNAKYGARAEDYSETDNVHHPAHYELDGLGVEVIDVIRSSLGADRFCGYCKGNIIKYILRADKKNHVEDLKKARVYLNWLIETCEEGDEDED